MRNLESHPDQTMSTDRSTEEDEHLPRAQTEDSSLLFPQDVEHIQDADSPSMPFSVDDDDDAVMPPPPPPANGLMRGRNLSSLNHDDGSLPPVPPPPALGRAVTPNAASARAGSLEDEDEEATMGPRPPLPPSILQRSPLLTTPPEMFSRPLSASASSLSPIPPPPFPASEDGIPPSTTPPAPASTRTESWASDATPPPPPSLGRSGSSQNRVMWRTGVDVDSFIGTGEEEESSEADAAESLIGRMRSIASRASADTAAEVPPSLSPKESSSSYGSQQDKDMSASLGAAAGGADVLTDAELPAIVSPELRRHSSSSSPGAYHANGSTTGVSPERLTRGSLTPPSLRSTVALTPPELTNTSSDGPIPAPPLSQADSCTTLVSATLVDEFSETEQSYSVRSQQQEGQMSAGGGGHRMEHLPYAHAEPLHDKRIRKKCVAAWFVLAAVTTLIFASLGSWLGDVKNSSQSEASNGNANGANETNSSSITPTTAPLAELTTDMDQETSSHVVMWGQLTTCNDTNFFTDYPMELECGGTIVIKDAMNAECTNTALAGHENIYDTSRVVCRFQQPEPASTDSGVFYQQATAHVIYNCIGESFNDHSGTASLPPMEVSGCGAPLDHEDPRRQRLLRAAVEKAPTAAGPAYPRALQDAIQVGASSFIAVGRFCSENLGRRWVLWHQFYRCERGERMFFTNFSDALNSLTPPSDWKSLLEWLSQLGISPEAPAQVSTAGSSNEPSPDGMFGDLLLSMFPGENNGGRKRRTRRLDDAISSFASSQDSMWDLLDLFGVRNVCYDTKVKQCDTSCRIDASGNSTCPTCSARVPPVQASDYDARDACRQREQGPSLEMMQRLVDDSFSPKIFTDRLAALI